jgi:serine protease Do
VPSRDELVQTVMALKPGTTVPMKVLRDKQEKTLNVTIGELNLDSESQSPEESDEQTEDTSAGFDMSLGNLTADRARRLELPAGTTGALITDLDPSGTAARGGLLAGDVILQVNRKKVESASEARTELQKIRSGGTTMLLIWRRNQEIFLTLKKD